jgi:hypothetical protein
VVRPRRLSVFESADLALVGQTSSPHGGIDHPPDPAPDNALTAAAEHDDVHVRHVTHQGAPSVAAYAQFTAAAVIAIGIVFVGRECKPLSYPEFQNEARCQPVSPCGGGYLHVRDA